MKVLVTGVSGQLGHDVMHELDKRGYTGIGSDIADNYSGIQDNSAVTTMEYVKMDITDEAVVDEVISSVSPDVIIHCAAWTAVDMAEDDDKVEKVRAVNAKGTANIAKAAKKLDCKMVYISTDYVFNGQGGTIGPLEEKEGYDKNYSTAVNVASAPVGMLIPPSNTMIVYSSVAGSVSIAALFMAGYIPGLLWGGAVMILAGIMAKKRGYQAEQRVPVKVALKTFWQAIPSLLLIVIVIGGILGGIFTATEGSAIAVVYATVLSLIYKAFKIKDIPRIVLEAAKTTGIITFMIGLSSIMSWAMAFTGIPDMIANAILGLTTNKYLILLLINVLLLVVGTFMDVTPAILIFTPILLPICKSFGMDPIHFGILLCFNLSIGTITPPVGTILFTGCRVGGTTIESVIKTLLPYFAIILIALLLVTYIPMLSMFLPKVLGLV